MFLRITNKQQTREISRFLLPHLYSTNLLQDIFTNKKIPPHHIEAVKLAKVKALLPTLESQPCPCPLCSQNLLQEHALFYCPGTKEACEKMQNKVNSTLNKLGQLPTNLEYMNILGFVCKKIIPNKTSKTIISNINIIKAKVHKQN